MRKAVIGGTATILVIVAVGGGLIVFGGLGGNAETQPIASAATDTQSDATMGAVAALGRIEPESEIIELGASAMDRLERLTVKEGQFVKKDEILGHLEGYEERVAEEKQIAAQLEEARRLHAAETDLGAAEIGAARIRLQQIREIYPLRIKAQAAKIKNLEVALANNRDIHKSRTRLLDRKAGSRRAADDQKTVVLQNEADLISARAELARLRTEMKLEQRLEQTRLSRAEAALLRAHAAIAIDSLESQLRVSQARTRRATVRAPLTGQILNIRTRPGERIAEKPILQMGNTEIMHAVAEVYETDIGRVKLGQTATVASPAFPKKLSGRVVDIGNLIFKNDILNIDPTADADARVVEVRIALDESHHARKLTNRPSM